MERLGHQRSVAHATRAPNKKKEHPTIANLEGEGRYVISNICASTTLRATNPKNELIDAAVAPAMTLNRDTPLAAITEAPEIARSAITSFRTVTGSVGFRRHVPIEYGFSG